MFDSYSPSEAAQVVRFTGSATVDAPDDEAISLEYEVGSGVDTVSVSSIDEGDSTITGVSEDNERRVDGEEAEFAGVIVNFDDSVTTDPQITFEDDAGNTETITINEVQ